MCIKPGGLGSPGFEQMKELFPSFSFHFVTRLPMPSMLSFRRIMMPFVRNLYARTGVYWKELVRIHTASPAISSTR